VAPGWPRAAADVSRLMPLSGGLLLFRRTKPLPPQREPGADSSRVAL